MTSSQQHIPEGNQEAIISALVLLILDRLERTAGTPDDHYRSLRAIFQRYPLWIVIAEIRNILAALYFPQRAELAHLVMQYHGVTLVPQQRTGGYCTTFIYNESLHSTPIASLPLKSLEFAQHMVDQLRAGVYQAADAARRPEEHEGTQPKQSVAAGPTPPVPEAVTPLPVSFIRVGRVAVAIDKILYIKDDSTAHYQAVRVGLAGGIDMRIGSNMTSNYIHTQEVRFVGEEASAFLAWHKRSAMNLPPLPEEQMFEGEPRMNQAEVV